MKPYPNVEKVMFENFHFGASARVSQFVLYDLAAVHRDATLRMGTIYQELSPVYNDLLITVRAFMLKSMHSEKKTVTFSAPATWWDHLKDDFLNSGVQWKAWLARQFAPPQYVTKSEDYVLETRVCPHNDTYFSENSRTHIDWLQWR